VASLGRRLARYRCCPAKLSCSLILYQTAINHEYLVSAFG
jgi:hypothetical protein